MPSRMVASAHCSPNGPPAGPGRSVAVSAAYFFFVAAGSARRPFSVANADWAAADIGLSRSGFFCSRFFRFWALAIGVS